MDEPVNPDVPEDAMVSARRTLGDAARARAAAWETVARLVGTPDADVIAGLRDGSVGAALFAGAAGPTDSAPTLENVLPVLETYRAAAARRDASTDLRDLAEDHEDLTGPPAQVGALRADVISLAEQALAEASAWDTGDTESAKTLLAQQHSHLRETVLPRLVPHAGALLRDGLSPLTRTVARLVLGFVSALTGTDHVRLAMQSHD